MFAINDNAISPAASSSSSLSPLVCPGTCGWWPAPSTALSGNLTATQQFSADYNDSWASAIAPGDGEALMELIFAHCKPCPWGTRRPLSSAQSRRSNSGGGVVPFSFSPSPSSFCHPCEVPLSTIDYLFLVFHAILPFVVNHVAINYHSARNLKHSRRLFLLNLCQLCCAFAECSLAFVGSLLLFRPFGQLLIFGCARDGKLSEWYSLFNNPVLQYTRVLHCSSELVYPLYSLPFAIYALNLFSLLTVRSFLHFTFAAFFNIVLPGAPFYATLWALPLLALAHAVLSGVLHALFPFIALLVALLHLVVHLSAAVSADSAGTTTTIRQMCRLLLSNSCCCCSNRRHHQHQRVPQHRLLPLWLPLLVHVALFAFALLTLFITFGAPNSGQWDEMIGTHFGDKWPIFLLILCALLPVPTLFFVLTIRLTAPGGIALANRRLSST